MGSKKKKKKNRGKKEKEILEGENGPREEKTKTLK